jgi:hypothetical protein
VEFGLLALATALALIPFATTTVVAVGIFALVYLWQRRRVVGWLLVRAGPS